MFNYTCQVFVQAPGHEPLDGGTCGRDGMTSVSVPYLMGGTAYVVLCAQHKAAHDQFFAGLRAQRKAYKVKAGK